MSKLMFVVTTKSRLLKKEVGIIGINDSHSFEIHGFRHRFSKASRYCVIIESIHRDGITTLHTPRYYMRFRRPDDNLAPDARTFNGKLKEVVGDMSRDESIMPGIFLLGKAVLALFSIGWNEMPDVY